MESKLLIDINYASRDPQIVIQYKESSDPRDKLLAMLSGQAMPGVLDGYCTIERFATENGFEAVIITPLHPGDTIKRIPLIKKLALENLCVDTDGYKETIERQDLEAVTAMCVESLNPTLFEQWEKIVEALKARRRSLINAALK